MESTNLMCVTLAAAQQLGLGGGTVKRFVRSVVSVIAIAPVIVLAGWSGSPARSVGSSGKGWPPAEARSLGTVERKSI